MNLNITEKKITITAIVVIVIFTIVIIATNFTKKDSKNLIKSLNDTIQIWKDKDSLSHAKIEIIQTEKIKDFTSLQLKDKDIKELQNLVNKYKKELSKGSATVFESVTNFTKKDTIYLDKFSYPDEMVVNDTIANDWVNITYLSKINMKDTTSILNFNLKVRDKYNVIIGEESQGLFKKKKPFVEITNLNPYSETKTIKTYQVSNKKKRFGIGPQIGVGLTGELKPNIYIGLGLSYNLIEF